MMDSRFSQIFYSAISTIVILLVSCCSSPRAAMHESWTLIQLLTQEERREAITEIIHVRNCGVLERKSVDCSAGTSNDLSVALGVSTGLALGLDLTIDPSVASELGFNRASGESLQLETPPQGYVYLFVVTKEYSITSGRVRARSSSGEERDGAYTFHASCSLKIESMETLTCAQATDIVSLPTEPTQEAIPIPASRPPTSVPVLPPTPTAASYATYSGWIICWHGRSNHEYLIAYPEASVRRGINLTTPMIRPWDGNSDDLTNDSLKMCQVDGTWYGDPLLQYFPFASHLRLEEDQMLVCENAPGCRGQQWTLKPSDPPSPVIVSLLRPPTGNAVQVLGYIESSQLP